MSVLLLIAHIYGTAAALLLPYVMLAWWQTWRRQQAGVALLHEAYAALYGDQPEELPSSPSAAPSRSEQP